MRQLALIRGINVGGKNIIKMTELKQLFEKIGLIEVKTYIQSGNVIFCNLAHSNAKSKIEEALSDKLKDDIKISILTEADLDAIVSNKPDGFGSETDKYKYDVIFMIEPLTASEALNIIKAKEDLDGIYSANKVLYIRRLKEGLHFPNLLKLPIYKNITIRNWNTTVKLSEMMKNNN